MTLCGDITELTHLLKLPPGNRNESDIHEELADVNVRPLLPAEHKRLS